MSHVDQYGRQSISEADVEAVVEVLRSDWLTTGPAVARFEEALGAACDGARAVACSSGTAGLLMAYAAVGVGPGDRVLVPDVTFLATATAALHLGATVELLDVDPETGNLDLDALERRLRDGPPPRLVVPVHYGGRPVDLDRLADLAERHGFAVVEDACHALGAHDGRHPIGAARRSAAAVFSFHPLKSITTAEGGAVLTRDEAIADRVRLLRHHGVETRPERFVRPEQAFASPAAGVRDASAETPHAWYHELHHLGWNHRLSDLHAALGASQLRRLARFVAHREALARTYDAAFSRHPWVRPLPRVAAGRSAHHLYVVRMDFAAAGVSRDAVVAALARRGVGCQVHYIPLHRQPALAHRCGGGPFDGAERFYAEALTLPLHAEMTPEDVGLVVRCLDEVFETLGRADSREEGGSA